MLNYCLGSNYDNIFLNGSDYVSKIEQMKQQLENMLKFQIPVGGGTITVQGTGTFKSFTNWNIKLQTPLPIYKPVRPPNVGP